MTEDRIYANSITAYVTAAGLHRLYEALEDEATPYEMRVKRVAASGHTHLVTIFAPDMGHFQEVIKICSDEAKA